MNRSCRDGGDGRGGERERERERAISRRVVGERRAMKDVDRREKTAREIARTRASIRKKHRALKTGKMESETALETRFKPIVEPLRRIAERIGEDPARDANAREEAPAKREIYGDGDDDDDDNDDDDDGGGGGDEAFARGAKRTVAPENEEEKGFKAKRSRRSSATLGDSFAATSTPVGALDVSPAGEREFARRDLFAGPSVEETFETSDDPLGTSATLETSVRRSLRTPRGRDILRDQLGPLARKYVGALLSGGAPSDFDHVYGVYFADAGTMLGNKRFDVGADDAIFVDGVRYAGTPGLYELIFKRIPDDLKYTERDKTAYRSILLQTNAHRREHNIRMPVLGNKGYKYKHVIAPIMRADSPRKRIGGGRAPPAARVPRAMRLTRDTVDYVHWDDPNELVDRLRLLDASRQAGNNAHDNEILSIIEELREAGEIL